MFKMGLMASKLNHKHKQQCDHEPPKKIQKLNGIEKPDTVDDQISITSIYYDCLERILDLLDLDDLFSVAQTCKRLQIAAAANFKDRYGKIPVHLYLKTFLGDFSGIHVLQDSIYVIGIEFCLQFLRCFGSKVLDLHIIYKDARAPLCHRIDHHINQYCADTLVSLFYDYRGQKFAAESFRKPFNSVKAIILSISNATQLPNFVDWFPNLCQLKIDSLSLLNGVPAHIPPLKSLSIGFNCDCPSKYVEDLLHKNQQLQSIEFICAHVTEMNMSKLLQMISENTSITSFKRFNYFASRVTTVNEDELMQLANKHPGLIELGLYDGTLNVDSAVRFFRQMDALKLFRFRIKERAEYDLLFKKLNGNWQHRHAIGYENDAPQYIVTLKK